MRRLPVIGLCFLVLLTVAPRAWADSYHYNSNLIGERALGLGGAFTALGSDVSGGFYNPAGLVDVVDDYLSLSMTLFQFRRRTIKDYRRSKDLAKTSINIVPGSAGTVYSIGPHRFALTLAVPDYDESSIEFNDRGEVPELHLNRQMRSQEYLLGPSLALSVNRYLAFGATLFGYYRNDSDYVSTLTRLRNVFENTTVSTQKAVLGFAPVIGVLVKPWDIFQIGASLRVGLPFWSQTKYSHTTSTNSTQVEPLTYEEHRRSDLSQLPTVFRGGLALKIWKGNLSAFDISFHDPVRIKSGATRLTLKPVVNFHAGIEQLLGRTWSLRGGFYTDFTSAPRIDPANPAPPPRIDLYGMTVALGRESAFTTFTAGLISAWGHGGILQEGRVMRLEEYYIGLFFGGSFRYGDRDAEEVSRRRWPDKP